MSKLVFFFPEDSFIDEEWHWTHLKHKGAKRITCMLPASKLKWLKFFPSLMFNIFTSQVAVLYSNNFIVWFVLALKRIGLFRNLKVILPEFNVNIDELSSFRANLKWMLLSFCLPACNFICVFSKIHKEALLERCKKLPSKALVIFEEPMAYASDEQSHLENCAMQDDYVLYAGRTNRDLKSFLQASVLVDLPIIVISKDKKITEYKKQYTNVSFLDEVPLQELERFISNARLFVVPLFETRNTSGLRFISLCFKYKTCVLATGITSLTERFCDEIIFMGHSPDDIARQMKNSYFDTKLMSRTIIKATEFYNSKGSSLTYARKFQDVLDDVFEKK